MAPRVTCAHGHEHPTIAAAKFCRATPPTPPRAPSAPSGVRPHVVHTSAAPTPAQCAAIARLGGVLAPDATRLEASRIIDALIAAKKATATTEPARRATMQQTRLGIPVSMIQAIREGRYAVSLDGSDRLTFIRTSVIQPPKRGYRAMIGWTKIQTQHSDDLIDRCAIAPDGQVRMMSHTMTMEQVRDLLLVVITDPRGAAIKYGRALQHCCSCGKALTDERSRHYGIGPDCEKRWPEIIDEVDEAEGPFVPSVGMLR